MEGPSPPAAPPVKRRRIFRALVLGTVSFVLITVLLLAGALLTLPWWLTPESLRDSLEGTLADRLGVPVSIARLDYDPWRFVRLEAVRIGPPPGYTRDVLRVAAIELRYDVSGWMDDHLAVDRLLIQQPQVVIETRNGRSNLDVIAARFPADEEAEPEPSTAPDRSRPVIDWWLELRDFHLDRLSIELVGAGPLLELTGFNARLAARIGPERLDARAKLAIDGSGPDNLRIDLPPVGDEPATTVTARLGLAYTATVTGRSNRGVTLERSGMRLMIDTGKLTVRGGRELPVTDLSLWAAASLDPAKDRLSLDDLGFSIDGERLLAVGFELDGLVAALDTLLGPAAAELLVAQLGLVRAGPGRATLKIPSIRLDLSRLEPLASAFVPRLDAQGVIELGPAEVSGSVASLLAHTPEVLHVPLSFSRLGVALPAEQLRISELNGKLSLDRGEPRGFVLAGAITAAEALASGNQVEQLRIGLDARVDRASYPDLGTSTIAIDLAAARILAPAAQLSEAKVGLFLSGEDVLASDRSALAPVKARAEIAAAKLRTGTGTQAISLAGVAAALDASLDRLLEPALQPITTALTLAVADARVPAQELHARGLSVKLGATTLDPRSGGPLDVAARLGLQLASLELPGVKLARASIALDTEAHGVPLAPAAGNDRTASLPESVRLDGKIVLPELQLSGEATGPMQTSVELTAGVSARPRRQEVTIRSMQLVAGELVKLKLSGAARRIMTSTPWIDLQLALEPLDFGKAKLPAALLERTPGLFASGKLSLDLTARGTIVPAEQLLERLDDPPLEVQGKLRSEALTVRLPSEGVELEELTGIVELGLGKGRAGAITDLRLARFSVRGPSPLETKGLSIQLEAGLRDRVWLARGGILLDQLRNPASKAPPLEHSRLDLDVAYPLFKNLELKRIALRVPDAGLDLTLSGKLERRRFGVLRPELDLEVGVDVDRLAKAPIPGASAALQGPSGRARVKLGVHSPDDETVELTGAVELDRFSYRMPGLLVERASGRLPLEQRLLLPAARGWGEDRGTSEGPKRDQLDAIEDLRLRTLDLLAALQERALLYVDPVDVLVTAPRTADYESMRPYYAAGRGARMTIERIVYERTELRGLSLDVMYRSGVLRLDRFALQLWDGDVYGELALQIAGADHLRLRLRSTITDLNLDVPVASALGRGTAANKELYLVSGNIDLRLDLRERALNGYMDLTRMGREMIVAIIDVLDPLGKDSQLQETRGTLATGGWLQTYVAGLDLKGVEVSIKQNLLNADFRWSGYLYDPRRLLIGTFVINAVKPVRRYSLSPFLENPAIDRLNDSVFAGLRGRIAEPPTGAKTAIASP